MNDIISDDFFSRLLSENRKVIMGFSILIIMLYHQNWFVDDPVNKWIHLLGYLGVEVFLLISGFGIAHSLRKNTLSQYYCNRVKRLMPACVVFGILKLSVCHLPYMSQSNNFFLWDLLSISHWYIYAIVIYYAMAPCLYRTINKYGWYVLIGGVILSYVVLYFWHFDADVGYFLIYGRWIVKRMPVFILGMTIAQKPLNLHPVKLFALGVVFMLLNIFSLHYVIAANANINSSSIIVKMFTSLPNRKDIPDSGRYLLDMMSVFFLCPMFVYIGGVLNRVRLKSMVEWFGVLSLEFYLCHQYIFKVIEMNINEKILASVISATLVLMVSVIIYWLQNLVICVWNRFC